MLTALIIDDDDKFVDNLKLHMEYPPSENSALRFSRVEGVFTCRDALRLARSGVDFDLIVYDLKLPWDQGGPELEENGIRLVEEIGPLQPLACGILVSGWAATPYAFKVGRLGTVRRLIEKPTSPEAIMLAAQDAIMEAAQKPKATFEKLSAGYHLQASLHEALNSLNNIVAAASEIKKLCDMPTEEFVASRSLPRILEEIGNIHTFQNTAAESLSSIHPVEATRREPCDLRRIAEWCVRYLKMQNPTKEKCLAQPSISATIPTTLGVREELQQMILLIATNALQAIAEDGHVEIAIRFDSGERGEIVLVVRDDGRGISEEDQRRLFDPDFTTRPGGSGQGLFLARAFAWNHGGRVRVESTEGAGTTVTVRLPLRGVQAGE